MDDKVSMFKASTRPEEEEVVNYLFTDDIIFHLLAYLTERDCIALSISGVCKRFSTLYTEKRKINLSHCYAVGPELFSPFISNCVCQLKLTHFDISHCYWLSEDVMLQAITSLPQLQELYIQDTKLRLLHCAQIFINCHLIVKLGISLVEEKWIMDESLISHGLGKLTHLKVLVFNSFKNYIESWSVILPLLSLCRKCQDLYIQLSCPTRTIKNIVYDHCSSYDYNVEFVTRARIKYFPNLMWMTYLKSFVFIKREYSEDLCLINLLNWIFINQEKSGFSFERLWIQDSDCRGSDFVETLTMNSTRQIKSKSTNFKSLSLPSKIPYSSIVNDRLRSSLQHVGSILLTKYLILPNIRFVQGNVRGDKQGIEVFCRAHPKLEHLVLRDINKNIEDDVDFSIEDEWTLKELKTLVYVFEKPDKSVLDRLLRASPNLVTLHIGRLQNSLLETQDDDDWESVDPNRWKRFYRLYRERGDDDALLKPFKFPRLTTLSLDLSFLIDQDFFKTIFSSCHQLRKLHLKSMFGLINDWFDNDCRYIPLLKELRDFRLQHKGKDDRLSSKSFLSLLKALTECTQLERVVYIDESLRKKVKNDSKGIENVLYQFVMRMQHLVAIWIVSEPLLYDRTTVALLNERLKNAAIPSRPSLWYHFGSNFSMVNHLSIPRIHYDEIIRPTEFIHIPPKFQ